jgi:segregation and condensation protein A
LPYHVKLTQFEGPLDLLLHLISNAKINIEEIFVSQITEQYIQHMEEIDELDMDRASEFLQMAATLLYINSRSLVPKRQETDEIEEQDSEQELIERLKKYKLYKDVCETFKYMEKDAACQYFKLAEELPQIPQKVSFDGISLEALSRAFLQAFQRLKTQEDEKAHPLSISKEVYSVKEKMSHILREIRRYHSISFFTLISESKSRMEAAVTFLAVLDLLHKNEISISQQCNFADITIYAAKKAG